MVRSSRELIELSWQERKVASASQAQSSGVVESEVRGSRQARVTARPRLAAAADRRVG